MILTAKLVSFAVRLHLGNDPVCVRRFVVVFIFNSDIKLKTSLLCLKFVKLVVNLLQKDGT